MSLYDLDGVKENPQQEWNKGKIKKNVLKLANELGRTPKAKEIENCDYCPSRATIKRHFKRYNEFLEDDLNLQPLQHSSKEGGINYTEQNAIEYIKKANEETDGDTLSRKQYSRWLKENENRREKNIPTTAWLERQMNWNDWIEKANINKNKRGTLIDYISGDIHNMTDSKAYIIGVCLGDGIFKTEKSNKSVALSAVDEEFVNEFADKLCEHFNHDRSELTFSEIEYSGRENCNKQYRVTKTSKGIVEELEKYLLSHWKNWYQELSESNKTSILRGLWDSEGSVNSGRIKFTNTEVKIRNLYLKLLVDVLNLTLKIDNLHGNITDKTINMGHVSLFTTYREDTDNTIYDVILRDKKSEFIEKVQPTIKRKFDN